MGLRASPPASGLLGKSLSQLLHLARPDSRFPQSLQFYHPDCPLVLLQTPLYCLSHQTLRLFRVGADSREFPNSVTCSSSHDDLSSRSQLLIEAFEILNIYSASTFGPSPFQALTTKSQ